MLNEQQLADLLEVPIRTVRVWRRLDGGPHPVKLGSQRVYLEPEITAWLDSGGARRCSIPLPLPLRRVADDGRLSEGVDDDGEQVGA